MRVPTTRKEETVEVAARSKRWLVRLAVIVGLLFAMLMGCAFLLSRADGPVFVFAGGPLRSGEKVDFAELDWDDLDALHELELEIVGAASSRTLWFSVHEGVPYVACDLDCTDGRLTRWTQQIERDDRVVIRIDAKRVDGRLIHVPHGSAEYAAARAGRDRKYSGDAGGRAAAEAAAHDTVVEVGEALTGRSKREEPGDRLYRVERSDGERR
jgi:hypothetical protein